MKVKLNPRGKKQRKGLKTTQVLKIFIHVSNYIMGHPVFCSIALDEIILVVLGKALKGYRAFYF